MAAYPPAPWQLRGRVALVPIPVRVAAARAAGVPRGARLLRTGPWTLGGLLLADYDETASLRYRELIVLSALAVAGGRPAFVVSHIYVDLEASLRGGREIWGLPKELARFDAVGGRVAVRRHDGVPLAVLDVRARARHARLPLWAPVVGTLGGAAVRAAGLGSLRASAGAVAVDVPASSPFAALGLGGPRPALVGDGLALRFPAPLAPNAGATAPSANGPEVLAVRNAG